jgi:hypothetical protein
MSPVFAVKEETQAPDRLTETIVYKLNNPSTSSPALIAPSRKKDNMNSGRLYILQYRPGGENYRDGSRW